MTTKYDVTQALIDLTGAISHDEDEADWYNVHELIDLVPNPASVLRDIMHWLHEEELV